MNEAEIKGTASKKSDGKVVEDTSVVADSSEDSSDEFDEINSGDDEDLQNNSEGKIN